MNANLESSARLLRTGIDALELCLSDPQQQRLLRYLTLFDKWNQVYNLSALRDIEAMVSRHLLDSLSVAPYLTKLGKYIIDVGTGGGLPGIPLAIAFPEKQFTLLDSNGKKTRFLFQAKLELKLDNISIENCRVESYQPPQLFDAVISRAFASLRDMTDASGHLLSPSGRFLAMKGIYPEDELSELAKHYMVESCYLLQVPCSEVERHLVVLAANQV